MPIANKVQKVKKVKRFGPAACALFEFIPHQIVVRPLPGDDVLLIRPGAEIDQLATLRTERPVFVLGRPFDRAAAGGAGDDAWGGVGHV